VADGYPIAVQIDRLTKSILPLLNAIQIACMQQLGDCIDVGCKLPEGSLLSKPKVVKGRKINANEVALLRLTWIRTCLRVLIARAFSGRRSRC